MASKQMFCNFVRKCIANTMTKLMHLTKANLQNGAAHAEALLKQARLDVSPLLPIATPGLFLADTHGGRVPCEAQAKTTAKHIALLENHKPGIVAMEFFSIDQTTFAPECFFSENLSIKNDELDPLPLDEFLAVVKNGRRLPATTKSANNLHRYFRMEGEEFDRDMVARTLLWLGYLNSVSDRSNLIGLDIPKHPLGDGLPRLCGTNPIWAETLAWRLSGMKATQDQPARWAMVAGAEHWQWTRGQCKCDLKDMLPIRLAAYGLPMNVTPH